MKNQINITNVTGAVVSAGLLVSSLFLPTASTFSFSKRIATPQIQKMLIPQEQMIDENNDKIVPAISSTSEISTYTNREESFQEKVSSVDEQKQELEQPEVKCEEVSKSIDEQKQELEQSVPKCEEISGPNDKQKQELKKSEDKCEEVSKSNGCPKNLDYFTMRPRPKQMPEECFTCQNLITCVCLTGKQSK